MSFLSGGDDGDPTASSRGVDPVANNSTRRQLKRALEGTVGVSLAVTAAVLLARSEEIGKWLRSAAPNVMPDAAAGADVVQRAIEQSKTCLQRDGLDVCLDVEGRVTALCKCPKCTHCYTDAIQNKHCCNSPPLVVATLTLVMGLFLTGGCCRPVGLSSIASNVVFFLTSSED